MINEEEKILLVGDNAFHNISHLSQERARARGLLPITPENAASLVISSLENGANGFMFSVSDTTLSILRKFAQKESLKCLNLYAIVPYTYEYVRLATQLGGILGLAKKFGKEVMTSLNMKTIGLGLKGALTADPSALLKTYLTYEISRIKSSANSRTNLRSVMLHQLITDLALSLDLDWLFRSYIDFLTRQGIAPGFNTGNFCFLIEKLTGWNIDLQKVTIAAPFNKVGFQMIPSREECERVLKSANEPVIIAISILAAGYLHPKEAVEYIATLPNIKGIAVGVSNEKHARETFSLLKRRLG